MAEQEGAGSGGGSEARNVRRLARMLAVLVFVPSFTTTAALSLSPGDHLLHLLLFGILSVAAVLLWLAAPRLGRKLGPHL